ncbi:Hypothetical predicted protein, partial [Paramuricea clavata]
KNFHKFKYLAFDSNKVYADDETLFPNLIPYSNYALQFITNDKSGDPRKRVTTTKSFTTPYGGKYDILLTIFPCLEVQRRYYTMQFVSQFCCDTSCTRNCKDSNNRGQNC